MHDAFIRDPFVSRDRITARRWMLTVAVSIMLTFGGNRFRLTRFVRDGAGDRDSFDVSETSYSDDDVVLDCSQHDR